MAQKTFSVEDKNLNTIANLATSRIKNYSDIDLTFSTKQNPVNSHFIFQFDSARLEIGDSSGRILSGNDLNQTSLTYYAPTIRVVHKGIDFSIEDSASYFNDFGATRPIRDIPAATAVTQTGTNRLYIGKPSADSDYTHLDEVVVTSHFTRGDIYKKVDAAAVKQALKNLLFTNTLEKPFRPGFGGDLRRYLFELNSKVTGYNVRQRIINQIQAYEPRARILKLEVKPLVDTNELYIYLEALVRNAETETIIIETTVSRFR